MLSRDSCVYLSWPYITCQDPSPLIFLGSPLKRKAIFKPNFLPQTAHWGFAACGQNGIILEFKMTVATLNADLLMVCLVFVEPRGDKKTHCSHKDPETAWGLFISTRTYLHFLGGGGGVVSPHHFLSMADSSVAHTLVSFGSIYFCWKSLHLHGLIKWHPAPITYFIVCSQ